NTTVAATGGAACKWCSCLQGCEAAQDHESVGPRGGSKPRKSGWYSWVGSNHRPPVPQTEMCFCPRYAPLRQSTNYSVISISKIALGYATRAPRFLLPW